MKDDPHVPVLLHEVADWAKLKTISTVIDCTVGFGGHAEYLLSRMCEEGRYFGIDKDLFAVEHCRAKFVNDHRIKVCEGRFSELELIVKANEIENVDLILFDLGVSSAQLDDPKYGLSLKSDSLLDMRIGMSEEGDSAFNIINSWGEDKLKKLFTENGQEKTNRIVEAILLARKENPINTTNELLAVLDPYLIRSGHIHPATKIFQALRVEANHELNEIKLGLGAAIKLLKVGGRVVVISFHSGEDRVVKEVFSREARDCVCPVEYPVCLCHHRAQLKILTPKPIIASDAEISKNSRSRSAKMRVAERI
jgi:16S rRNA (cytosine1402-N4)-methyltransferase